VPSHPGRVVEGKVAVVCNGQGFGVLIGMLGIKVNVYGSFHHGGNILAEGIQCARIKILELYDLLHVYTCPYIVPPLL
jgi:hypothetical protein